ncbi:MAG: AAA family ATPase [Methanocellales archaeon]|nr:AAA family ATPase [Methanocellales archaeon]MDD3292262.1 AAA family ATPase [Methanocellales archaeon]MDD5485852.1 AAA family ATPase [Methanocellales archaeon]
MKICITGKGGVGKTTFAGTLARMLARDGFDVIAIDADPAQNLHSTLGIDKGKVRELVPLAEMGDLIEERTGASPDVYGAVFKLNPKVSDLPRKLWMDAPDGVKFILMGTVKKGGSGCTCPANVMLKTFLKQVLSGEQDVIVDMEAGVEHLGRGTAKYADALIAVTEATPNSMEVVKKIMNLAGDIGLEKTYVIGNKVADEEEEKFINENFDNILGIIPFDYKVREAEMGGEALVNFPTSKAFKAISEIKNRLVKEIFCEKSKIQGR